MSQIKVSFKVSDHLGVNRSNPGSTAVINYWHQSQIYSETMCRLKLNKASSCYIQDMVKGH